MQHIRSYSEKIEAIIASRTAPKETKKKAKGLLAPSKDVAGASTKERTQLEMIADIVQGIREAKEEILNAGK